ncbi:hypothetical protein [Aquimarina agarivorans]|uniref:hypothetical protein n=1 Tax=Aquimarina agarivorans TaxID=980584 RepID=UPI000248FB46|nr:hypothetical protein [Aquimarina agarivorans]
MEIHTLELEPISADLGVSNSNQEPVTDLLNNFKLSDLFDDFNSSNIDDFIFDDVSISKSSVNGVNSLLFLGSLRMDGALAIFEDYLGSESSIVVAATINSGGASLSEKVKPTNAIFTSVVAFHKEIFKGVTLVETSLELDISKNEGGWSIVPRLTGVFDVNLLTDNDEGYMRFKLTEKNNALMITANAKNLNGAFGIDKLTLDSVTVQGQVGAVNSLNLSSEFIIGETALNFNGILTPDNMSIVASATSFGLNDLANLFNEISGTGLMLLLHMI